MDSLGDSLEKCCVSTSSFSQTLIDVSTTQVKSSKDYTGENVFSLFAKTARERKRDYVFLIPNIKT